MCARVDTKMKNYNFESDVVFLSCGEMKAESVKTLVHFVWRNEGMDASPFRQCYVGPYDYTFFVVSRQIIYSIGYGSFPIPGTRPCTKVHLCTVSPYRQ